MKRRNALKMLGTLVICLAGTPVKAAEKTGQIIDWSVTPKPTSYEFSEEGIEKLVIKRKDGSRLEIPFSEVVEALSRKQEKAPPVQTGKE